MNPRDVYKAAADALYFLQKESDIEFHMTQETDDTTEAKFKARFNTALTDLHTLLEAYFFLLDHEESEAIKQGLNDGTIK